MEIKKGENANLAGMEPPEGKVQNFDDPETIVDHIVGMVADDGSITDVARELAIDYVRTRLLYAGLERLAYIVEEKLTEPAGMEPRCPKCSAKVEFVMLSDSAAGIAAMCANDHRFPLYKGLDDCHVFFRTPVLRCPCCESENVTLEQNEIARWVACHNPKCGLTHHVSTNPELAQFFRSPAPTPPNLYQIFKHKDGCTWLTELPTGVGTWGCSCGLDKLLLELEDYELNAPTPPLDDNNPVVCSMRAAALAFGGCEDLEKAVTEGRMNMQGEWPTPSLDVEAAAQEINEDEITRIRTGRSRLTEKGIADILRRHIASPAQPEKRDA